MMRFPTLATVVGLVLACGGSALADGAFRPSQHVAPLPGGHFLCDVGFPLDGTAIGSAGSFELDRAADAMKTDEDALIVLDSHADASGPTRHNTALTLHRAEAVKDGLVARGIDPDRVLIAVYGEHNARGRVGPGDRRVDIWMTYTVSIKDIVERSLAVAEAVVWTRPLTQQQFEHRPRLTASRPKTSTGLTASR